MRCGSAAWSITRSREKKRIVVFEAVDKSKHTDLSLLHRFLTVAPLLWLRIYRTVIVLLQIVVYGDSRQPFFAAILIVSLAVIGWRESLLPGLCWTGGGVPPIQLSRTII